MCPLSSMLCMQPVNVAARAIGAVCSLRHYMGFINRSSERLVDVLLPACESGKPVEMWRLVSCCPAM